MRRASLRLVASNGFDIPPLPVALERGTRAAVTAPPRRRRGSLVRGAITAAGLVAVVVGALILAVVLE